MADDDEADFQAYQKAAASFVNGEGVSHLALQWAEDIRLEGASQTLVKGMLGKGRCSLWYGDSGTGKSFLALDLGLHLALCREWFGRRVAQALVVYIAAEAGGSMRRRVIAFFQHHGVSAQDVPFALIASPINLLDASPDLPALLHEIETARARFRDLPVLVIIDTLSRALAGGNENMPDDMGAFIRHVDRLREVTGAHVAIVHHTGKTPGQGARGHSLLKAAVDSAVEISRPEASKQSVALVTKQRDEDTGASFGFKLQMVEVGYDEDGDPVTSCVVQAIEGQAAVPQASNAKARPLPPEDLRLLDFLRDIVAEVGKPLNRDGYPNVKAVTFDQWRDHCQKRGLYDPEDRKAFKRRKDRLVAARLITIDGELVWPVPSPWRSSPSPGSSRDPWHAPPWPWPVAARGKCYGVPRATLSNFNDLTRAARDYHRRIQPEKERQDGEKDQ
jgi:hypothetical protein